MSGADATPRRAAQARNDAKLRAVSQRVDYETFKNMARFASRQVHTALR